MLNLSQNKEEKSQVTVQKERSVFFSFAILFGCYAPILARFLPSILFLVMLPYGHEYRFIPAIFAKTILFKGVMSIIEHYMGARLLQISGTDITPSERRKQLVYTYFQVIFVSIVYIQIPFWFFYFNLWNSMRWYTSVFPHFGTTHLIYFFTTLQFFYFHRINVTTLIFLNRRNLTVSLQLMEAGSGMLSFLLVFSPSFRIYHIQLWDFITNMLMSLGGFNFLFKSLLRDNYKDFEVKLANEDGQKNLWPSLIARGITRLGLSITTTLIGDRINQYTVLGKKYNLITLELLTSFFITPHFIYGLQFSDVFYVGSSPETNMRRLFNIGLFTALIPQLILATLIRILFPFLIPLVTFMYILSYFSVSIMFVPIITLNLRSQSFMDREIFVFTMAVYLQALLIYFSPLGYEGQIVTFVSLVTNFLNVFICYFGLSRIQRRLEREKALQLNG